MRSMLLQSIGQKEPGYDCLGYLILDVGVAKTDS